jgi:hypothetical protein
MRRISASRLFTIAAVGAASALTMAAPASAHPSDRGLGANTFQFGLSPVPHAAGADNGSNVSGTGMLDQRGRQVTARIRATGLDALPHAMHIHGKDNPEVAFCPGADRRDDVVNDGLIETVEGLSDYGPIKVSFTLFGDSSPASALDLGRFPVANAAGVLTYERRLKVSSDVARRLDDMHVVIHGEDLDNNGAYGGRTTALGAPLEAELPVACGKISG